MLATIASKLFLFLEIVWPSKELLIFVTKTNPMKAILRLLIIFSAIQLCSAQYWYIPNDAANRNPGDLNADAERPSGGGLPGGWSVILNAATSPVWSTSKSIPFTFSFNNQPVSNFKVSNSGVLTFDVNATTVPGFQRYSLPNASIPDRSVCITGLTGIASNDIVITKTFGTAPNRQFWIQFNSYGYGSVPSDGSNYAYWSIVLEETSNRIHIVDQRTGGYATTKLVSIGLQINASTAIMIKGSPDLLSKAGTSDGPIDNQYYSFVQGNQGKYDLTVVDITTSPYQVAGKVVVTAIFRNLGTQNVNSLRLNYMGDNNASGGDVKNVRNIATFNYDTVSHIIPWEVVSGTHNLEVFADDINGGNADENQVDDKKKKKIYVMERLESRTPLFEVYSSSTCPPCKPANEKYLSVLENKNPADYVSIKFQQNFPGNGDPYATTESINRRGYYFINSIPRTEIDGGWDKNGNLFSEEVYAAASKVPAFYALNGTYKVEGQKVTANINYSPLFEATGAKLYIAILEKITYYNVATNGETEFHHVMKKMLPSETGTILPAIPALSSRSNNFSYTFNGDYRLPPDGQTANIIDHTKEHSVEDFSNLYVVAWIQGLDKQVFQAANLSPEGTSSVNEKSGVQSAFIYPNPAEDELVTEIRLNSATDLTSTIVDASGNSMLTRQSKFGAGNQTLRFNIQHLSPGYYQMVLNDKEGNSSVLEFVKK